MKFIHHILLLAGLFCNMAAFAQQNKCAISGKIIDAVSQETVPFAVAQIFDGEKAITGVVADMDGKFTLQINVCLKDQ